MLKKLTLSVVIVLMMGVIWRPVTTDTAVTGAAITTEKLILTGSSTLAPLVSDIGKRFESINPNVRIDVQTGGSSRGVNDARTGLADIGMASRVLKTDETDLFSFTIALDGISIIVNSTNPIVSLDKQDIINIYTGKINNWKALGGHDAPITVVNKAEGRSTLELFLQHFGLQNTEVKPHVVIGDNQQGIKTIAGNPDAIGYVSVGSAEYEVGQGIPIKLLPLDNIPASVVNVRNRTFPLSRPLNLVTRNEPSGMVKAFIEFARSEPVNDLIQAHYFVPVTH